MTQTQPPSANGPDAGGTPMAPLGFQRASDILRATPSSSSNRNASDEAPPTLTTEITMNGAEASNPVKEGSAPPKVGTKPINRPATSKNAIVYNAVQRRNPVLQCIKNVGIEIGDIAADYQVGTHNGVLFLSLKYHRLHPEYIHTRIEKMKNMYNVRILLVLCDINEHQQSLREITKIAIINQFTLFVAWSNEEVAQYLTTFKAYEHKGDETLKEPIHQSYYEQFYHVMTSGKKVNKTDADNLASQFGSFANISKQHSKVLGGVKGLGATKVTSLFDAFNKPFLIGGLKRNADGVETTTVNTDIQIDGPGFPVAPAVAMGSPDWPEEENEDSGEMPISRGRERVPSRSPGISPAPDLLDASGQGRQVATWKDPLDDDSDEDGGENEGPSKRARA